MMAKTGRINSTQTCRKELVAAPRKTASGGKFQADLAPADILDEAAIAGCWAQSAAISLTQAKTHPCRRLDDRSGERSHATTTATPLPP